MDRRNLDACFISIFKMVSGDNALLFVSGFSSLSVVYYLTVASAPFHLDF